MTSRALVASVLICVALEAADAQAQVSGSVSIVSNYRYRGVSLSHNDPAAQAALVYDDPQGLYAGAFASTVRIGYPTSNEVQGILFAGYARTTPIGATFEAGVVYSGFTGATSYAYPELLVGATYEKVNARVHYSPELLRPRLGRDVRRDRRRVPAARSHAAGGARRRAMDECPGRLRRARSIRCSTRASAFVFDFDRFNVQLSWVGISDANPATGSPACGAATAPWCRSRGCSDIGIGDTQAAFGGTLAR